MEAIKMIKERRSVRSYKDEQVDMELMKEIVEISRWSPSWANYQVARYNLIDDLDVISKIANDGVNDFVYNTNTLKDAKGVLVLSYVEGKSGKLDSLKGSASSEKLNTWEVFDAGIACQTFCLAAHAKGVGTCIMGVIDEDVIAEAINLPSDEKVAALIVYGYPAGDTGSSSRKSVEELVRVISKK